MTTKLDKKSSSVDVQSRTNKQSQVERCETVPKRASGRVKKPAGTRKSVRLELKRMSMKEVQQAVAAGKQARSQDKRKVDKQAPSLQTQTAHYQPETIYGDDKNEYDEEESIIMIEGEEDVDAEVVPVPSTARQKAERHNARVKQLSLMRMRDIAESREMRLLRRRGLHVQKPTPGTKHVMWADKSELVRIYRYSPTIT